MCFLQEEYKDLVAWWKELLGSAVSAVKVSNRHGLMHPAFHPHSPSTGPTLVAVLGVPAHATILCAEVEKDGLVA